MYIEVAGENAPLSLSKLDTILGMVFYRKRVVVSSSDNGVFALLHRLQLMLHRNLELHSNEPLIKFSTSFQMAVGLNIMAG
jgi:hypothetical protein